MMRSGVARRDAESAAGGGVAANRRVDRTVLGINHASSHAEMQYARDRVALDK